MADQTSIRTHSIINPDESALFNTPPTGTHPLGHPPSVEHADALKAKMKHEPAGEPRAHPRFFFPDGNVVFLVDATLFRVHRYYFARDSPVFGAMFSLPPPPGERAEGETAESPIVLAGVRAPDFATFLAVLYPADFATSELSAPAEWLAVLAVATRWDFASVRRLALARLGGVLGAAERIAVGRAHDVQEWLAPAYTELCMRAEPLALAEGERLGMRDVVEIYRVRSLIRYHAHLNRHRDTIGALIKHEFGIK